ncbi:hypothetical protein [Polaromonas sp. LjRoot131]|uniref:hypothetical protein n=1 Tax=Polaromonas sp. LjRoot131 TaxID=3342262 RepID=UPI003ED0AC23
MRLQKLRVSVFVFALLSILGMQGCTQLDAVRVKDGKSIAAEGAPYNLTFTQYEIAVTRRLASCIDDKTRTPLMKVVTTADATRKEVRDPTREYIIDFAALRSFFKTSDITIEYYDNGSLKTVNASVADKTGEFLKSAFASVGKIALMTAGGGGPAEACTPEIAKIVLAAEVAEKSLVAKKNDLTLKTGRLEKRIAVSAAQGRARSDEERRAFGREVDALFLAKTDVDAAQKALASLLKKLTISSKLKWPSDGSTFEGQLVTPLTPDGIKDWGSLSDEGEAKLSAGTGVWAKITTDSPMGRHAISKGVPCPDDEPKKGLNAIFKGVTCLDDESKKGLKYRIPVPGTLLLCSSKDCKGEDAVLAEIPDLFSQLGPILTLPLRNYPFMDQTVVLNFNEAGQPTKIGYKSTAAADKAADAFGTYVDELGKVRLARKPKSELDVIKEETELLEAKAKLASAKKGLEPASNAQQAVATSALKADTELLEAELAKMKAQAALDDARKQSVP